MVAKWPHGSGEMVERIRAHDWASTALGPVEGWPPRLKYAVELVLANPNASAVSWGPDLLQIYNDKHSEILGSRHPAALGRPRAEDIAEEAEATLAARYRLLSTGEAIAYEDRLFTPPGSDGKPHARWFSCGWTPIKDEDGCVLGFIASAVDVTEGSLARLALRESEERFWLFAKNVQEYALVQTDTAGLITDWNTGAERLFGFTSAEMTGESFGTLFTPEDDAAAVFAKELSYVSEGHTNEDARWFVRENGSRFWARCITEPIYDESGGFSGLAKVMRDETERERDSSSTRIALSDKEELLKEVHHRVKNNLQVIISLLNLQSRQIDDERVLTLLEESRNRVQSIATIHELIYRADTFASIVLSTYARRLVPDLVNFYGLQDRVTPEILGDGAALELERAVPFGMLLNELVSNACKHAYVGRECGKLVITCTEEGDKVELAVSDDGPGLSPAFDYRNATSLGLKLVHGLVRQLGGELSIDSGAGTTVRVRFHVMPGAHPEIDALTAPISFE
jgi:PAS domain S-box-containing protein